MEVTLSLSATPGTAIFWTLSGGGHRTREQLRLSILSVAQHAHVSSSLLVLHDGALNCTGLGLEKELPCTSFGPAQSWELTRLDSTPPKCRLGALSELLRAHTLHLLHMDHASDIAIIELSRSIRSRMDPGRRSDLTNHALRGNNYRLFAAPLLLSLGVRSALYLDLDTRVLRSLGGIFDARGDSEDGAALVVANRSSPGHTARRAAREFGDDADSRARLRRWGFDAESGSFNAGARSRTPNDQTRSDAPPYNASAHHRSILTRVPLDVFRRSGDADQHAALLPRRPEQPRAGGGSERVSRGCPAGRWQQAPHTHLPLHTHTHELRWRDTTPTCMRSSNRRWRRS